jgi:phenylalanyl-tRNA synthetase alpha subunit
MKLTLLAINLLKHVLMYDGKKEVNNRGQEALSLRKLSNQESSQRRHFFKKVEEFVKKQSELFEDAKKIHNELVNRKRDKLKKDIKQGKETKEFYDEKINKELNKDEELKISIENVKELNDKLNKDLFEFEITDETKTVINKYFEEYGNQVGYVQADDDVVLEISDQLK